MSDRPELDRLRPGSAGRAHGRIPRRWLTFHRELGSSVANAMKMDDVTTNANMRRQASHPGGWRRELCRQQGGQVLGVDLNHRPHAYGSTCGIPRPVLGRRQFHGSTTIYDSRGGVCGEKVTDRHPQLHHLSDPPSEIRERFRFRILQHESKTIPPILGCLVVHRPTARRLVEQAVHYSVTSGISGNQPKRMNPRGHHRP